MRLLATLSLLLCGANWSAVAVDRCDIVAEVRHWSQWGGNEQHDISATFLEWTDRTYWHLNTRRVKLHDLTTQEIIEGVRVAETCRIIGRWMDSDRSVILPLRVEVIQRRQQE